MQRSIAFILRHLLLGALAAFAVAAVFGLTTDSLSMRVKASGYSAVAAPAPHGWYVQSQQRLGKRHVVSHYVVEPAEINYHEQTPAERVLPRWAIAEPSGKLYEGERQRSIDVACGWPAPMLHGRVDLDRDAIVLEGHAFIFAAGHGIGTPTYGYQVRGVPLNPIWWGVVINSIVWAVPVWLMILAFGCMRRMWRNRQGICPRCTYDLRGGPHEHCPECGLITPGQVFGGVLSSTTA